MLFRIQEKIRHSVLQNKKNVLLINPDNKSSEALIKSFEQTNWRVFTLGNEPRETTTKDPKSAGLHFDARKEPALLSEEMASKAKEKTVKLDAILAFTPAGLENVGRVS